MPHESTVEHEIANKEYGPIENARRALLQTQNSVPMENNFITEDHECDESDEQKDSDWLLWNNVGLIFSAMKF